MNKIKVDNTTFNDLKHDAFVYIVNGFTEEKVRFVKYDCERRPFPEVKRACKRQGITLKKLSEKIYVSYQYLVNGLNGHSMLDADTKESICNVLGKTREELFEE